MIDEARALLSIIDAAGADEDIDEDPVSRKTRLTLRTMAGRLLTEIVTELRPAAAAPLRSPCRAAVAYVWAGPADDDLGFDSGGARFSASAHQFQGLRISVPEDEERG
jgi:hypothetical protein